MVNADKPSDLPGSRSPLGGVPTGGVMPSDSIVPEPAVRTDDPPIFPTTIEVAAAKRAQADSLPPESAPAIDVEPAILDGERPVNAPPTAAADPQSQPPRGLHQSQTSLRTALLSVGGVVIVVIIIAAVI